MELRSVWILVLGILGLAASVLIPAAQIYILFTMAAVPLALLVIGQAVLPHAKRSIRVWFDPIVIEIDGEIFSFEPGTPMGRLSGRDLVYSYFKQWHEFEIVTHRFLLLAAVGLSSLAGMWFALRVRIEFIMGGTVFYYYLLFVWLIFVGLSKRWLWERRMLRREGVSIGTFSIKRPSRTVFTQMRYHFVDPEGEYRGGMIDALSKAAEDDMTVVFYDAANPDRNIPASALLFHKLIWKERAPRPAEKTVSEGA